MKRLGGRQDAPHVVTGHDRAVGWDRDHRAAAPALAQYPEKPLTILEPWAPGSAGDVPMRILAELASEDFGQPIVVQNLEGGTGTRAQLAVKNAEPDGYTIMNSWVAPQVMAPIFNPDVGYTRHDFEPIILVNINPFVLVVPGDHPANTTTTEFVEWAKAQPGKPECRRVRLGGPAAPGVPPLSRGRRDRQLQPHPVQRLRDREHEGAARRHHAIRRGRPVGAQHLRRPGQAA